MPTFRVTFTGYVEGEYETAEEAKAAMLEMMTEGDTLRSPEDFLEVERFDEEKSEWVPA